MFFVINTHHFLQIYFCVTHLNALARKLILVDSVAVFEILFWEKVALRILS